MIIIETWLDSGANHASCNKKRVSVEDIGYSDEEWRKLSEDDRDHEAKEFAFSESEWGWVEVEQKEGG
jgi:hypothetical protein